MEPNTENGGQTMKYLFGGAVAAVLGIGMARSATADNYTIGVSNTV